MNGADSHVPERRKMKHAIENLEAAYHAGQQPDLTAMIPAGSFRVPYLLALIPIDMACRLKYTGDRVGSTVEAYLATFPEIRSDSDAVAQLILAEHAAHCELLPTGTSAESTQHDTRLRFNYLGRFPELWPKLFPYTDTSRLPEPGERIGDWVRVECLLGRGGMGVVFECRDERLKRSVAVKLLDPAGTRFTDSVFRDRFLREAESLAKVDHPNVVKVYFAGLIAGSACEVPYFVMEYIDGEPLDRRLRSGVKLPIAETMRLAREITAALQAVHAAGLIHRDVNPRNVMLQPDGKPVLLDLGLVRSLDAEASLSEPGALMGTVAYMAPEQAEGGEVDCRADLFSLGCILYLAVTGIRAFPGEQIMEVLTRIKTFDPPPPDDAVFGLPVGFGNLIARLMAKNATDRPGNAAEVLSELDKIATGSGNSPLPKQPDPIAPPLDKTTSSRARLIWAVLTVVGVTGIVLVALFIRSCLWSGEERSTKYDAQKTPVVYRGQANVSLYRNGWLPVIHPNALPLKVGDHFVVNVQIEPAAYLYVFWVDPDGETAPIYPWTKGWGSRPPIEKPMLEVRLPEESDFEPDPKKPLNGVITIVAFACPEKLLLPDNAIQEWFAKLPIITREKSDTRPVVWFDDYIRPRGGSRLPQTTGLIDPYERWQRELKKRVGNAAAFQTSISFAQGNN